MLSPHFHRSVPGLGRDAETPAKELFPDQSSYQQDMRLQPPKSHPLWRVPTVTVLSPRRGVAGHSPAHPCLPRFLHFLGKTQQIFFSKIRCLSIICQAAAGIWQSWCLRSWLRVIFNHFPAASHPRPVQGVLLH